MLDLEPERQGPPPKPAATLILLRDGEGGVEVFCVERNKKSRFLGGAIVFPGGKLDADDADPAWVAQSLPPHPATFAEGDELRALAVAACRESLEEAAILPLDGALTHEELLALRLDVAAKKETLRAFLARRGLRVDLAALHPFARWITPTVEARRFDARFFVARAPEGQPGAHDMAETMASFWATPTDLLARFERQEVQLAPPTHRTVTVLAAAKTVDEALADAARACLEPICPELVPQGDTLALTLPGDPQHSVKESRVPGPSRYFLRGEIWRAEAAP